MEIQDCDAIILCGGLGTRFREVIENRPKGLAPLAGKPILELLIDDLVSQGIRRIILCVGYLREQIIDHFKNRYDVEILFSIEETPLGTGGAIKNAANLIKSEHAIILNGDSLCKVSFKDFFLFHCSKKSILSIVVTPAEDSKDYGNITLGENGRIVSFKEKITTTNPSLVNGGIYLMQSSSMHSIKGQIPISIEHDFFPSIIKTEACFGYVLNEAVLDIGTAERYQKINQIMQDEQA
jgi:D-glycero-alpha-D-manno-heptose 1-phosphate guanylyltransferase